MKTCTRCHTEKTFDNFSKASREKDGFQYHCKQCNKELSLLYRLNNSEKEKLRHKEYENKNKTKRSEYQKQWTKDNPEKVKQKSLKYYYSHKDKNAAKASKRRAAERQATVSWSDQKKIDAIYAECARITKETGIKHHVDHIIPLTSDIICGLHHENNLQILSAFENQSKHNKF